MRNNWRLVPHSQPRLRYQLAGRRRDLRRLLLLQTTVTIAGNDQATTSSAESTMSPQEHLSPLPSTPSHLSFNGIGNPNSKTLAVIEVGIQDEAKITVYCPRAYPDRFSWKDPYALDRCQVPDNDFPSYRLHISAKIGHLEFSIELLKRKPELAEELDGMIKLEALKVMVNCSCVDEILNAEDSEGNPSCILQLLANNLRLSNFFSRAGSWITTR
ncbi:hypothetical protein AKJ16_DCAP17152 [Drosera capensis]